MTATERTTPAPESATDPLGYEEDADYAIRAQLGLRPIAYAEYPDADTYPDQRSCPPWCWARDRGPHVHGVEPAAIAVAQHSSPTVSVMASWYEGMLDAGLVTASTIDVTLLQAGHGQPRLRLVHFLGEKRRTLVLSPTDARELITVMTWLLGQADAADATRDEWAGGA